MSTCRKYLPTLLPALMRLCMIFSYSPSVAMLLAAASLQVGDHSSYSFQTYDSLALSETNITVGAVFNIVNLHRAKFHLSLKQLFLSKVY